MLGLSNYNFKQFQIKQKIIRIMYMCVCVIKFNTNKSSLVLEILVVKHCYTHDNMS